MTDHGDDTLIGHGLVERWENGLDAATPPEPDVPEVVARRRASAGYGPVYPFPHLNAGEARELELAVQERRQRLTLERDATKPGLQRDVLDSQVAILSSLETAAAECAAGADRAPEDWSRPHRQIECPYDQPEKCPFHQHAAHLDDVRSALGTGR